MVRVLRIMEYTYETNEQAEKDMSNWVIAANGTTRYGYTTIKSATIIDLTFKDEDGN